MNIRILKPSLPLIAAASFAAAAYFVWVGRPVDVQASPLATPPASAFANRVAATGIVEPASENIALGTPVPGLIMQVQVSVGQDVVAGQPLFSLDDRDLRAALEVRRAELDAAGQELARLRQLPRPEDLPPLQARVNEAQAAVNDARVQLKLIESVDDERAIRQEDLLRRRIAVKAAEARLSSARAELDRQQAGAWAAEIAVAEAAVEAARQRVAQVEVDIDRLTVRAPRDGRVLQLNARVGEFAASGPLPTPLVVFGDVSQLHVRADVDENEAWAVRPGASVTASPRGNAGQRHALSFVRVEPAVVPKRQLTGAAAERVDTRVLQVIYRLAADGAPLYVGQQMDVFIERAPGASDAVAVAGEEKP
jgi:multidrug resistance efflux pump